MSKRTNVRTNETTNGKQKGKTPSSAYKTVIINKMLLQFVDFMNSSQWFERRRQNRRPLTVCSSPLKSLIYTYSQMSQNVFIKFRRYSV